MKTVFKYVFQPGDEFQIMMPVGARILKVKAQRDVPCIWAFVDTDATTEVRRFRMVGTGHPADVDPEKHIGTFELMDGELVFHLFEV